MFDLLTVFLSLLAVAFFALLILFFVKLFNCYATFKKNKSLGLNSFKPYGYTLYVGRPGTGKTCAMIPLAERMEKDAKH